jgi:hypothetical protein
LFLIEIDNTGRNKKGIVSSAEGKIAGLLRVIVPCVAAPLLTFAKPKDCDVTWLYGPPQTESVRSLPSSSANTSYISKSNSILTKKPILRK